MTASATKAPRKTVRKPRKAAAPKVAKVTTPKRPSSAKLISPSRYVDDAKQRWAIHEYEVNALFQDISKGYKATSSYVKDSYVRAFN